MRVSQATGRIRRRRRRLLQLQTSDEDAASEAARAAETSTSGRRQGDSRLNDDLDVAGRKVVRRRTERHSDGRQEPNVSKIDIVCSYQTDVNLLVRYLLLCLGLPNVSS